MNTPPLPPPSIDKGRDPWKVFGIVVIATVVIGAAVAVGVLIGAGGDDESAQTSVTTGVPEPAPETTVEPRTSVVIGTLPPRQARVPRNDVENNDMVISDAEYEWSVQWLTDDGVNRDYLDQLTKVLLTDLGDWFCRQTDSRGSVTIASRAAAEAITNGYFSDGVRPSSQDVDSTYKAMIVGSASMCLDLFDPTMLSYLDQGDIYLFQD